MYIYHTHNLANVNKQTSHLWLMLKLAVYEMQPPDPDYILRGFDGPVTSLVFLPSSWEDGRCDSAAYLVAGTQTGSLFVWNLKTRRVVHSMMSVHANSVLSVTVLGGDDEVLSQGREGVLIRWKLLAIDNWLKTGWICCHFVLLLTFCAVQL